MTGTIAIERVNRVGTAAILVLAAMALLGFVDNYVKVIAEGSGLWQFHLMRSLMALPLIAAAGLAFGLALRPRRLGRVLVRSSANSLAMVLYFGALAFLPIGQVVAGMFTAPIFVVLISVVIFGQRIGPWRIFAVVIGFAGVLAMLEFDGARLSLLSVVPVLGGLFYAITNVLTREWCAEEGTLCLIAFFFAFMAVWGIVGIGVLAIWPQPVPAGADGFILRGWTMPSGEVLFWTAAQAVGSVVALAMIVRAYQIAEPSYVAVFEYALLVSAVIWAYLLWSETMTPVAMAGMAAIAVSGIVIALRARPRPQAAAA